MPIVLQKDTIIDTDFGEVVPESLEISGGIQLEIAGGARLEITGQVSGPTPNNLGQAPSSIPPVVATAIPLTTFRNFAYFQIYSNNTFGTPGFSTAFSLTLQTLIVDSRGNWARFTSTSSAAPASIIQSTDFIRLEHNPELLIHFRLGSDISSQRLWIGFWTAAQTDTDTSVRPGCGVRYSTVAGDTGFVLQTSDGTSQNLGATLGTIVASDEYLLHIVISGNGTTMTVTLEQFSTGLTTSASINILRIALGQNMEPVQARMFSQVAGNRLFDVERASIYWGFQMPATVG